MKLKREKRLFEKIVGELKKKTPEGWEEYIELDELNRERNIFYATVLFDEFRILLIKRECWMHLDIMHPDYERDPDIVCSYNMEILSKDNRMRYFKFSGDPHNAGVSLSAMSGIIGEFYEQIEKKIEISKKVVGLGRLETLLDRGD